MPPCPLIFLPIIDGISCQCQITAHCIHFALKCNWVSWALSQAQQRDYFLGSVCEQSFLCAFGQASDIQIFEYSNYSNSFMVEYSNGKIGICHRPNEQQLIYLHNLRLAKQPFFVCPSFSHSKGVNCPLQVVFNLFF